MCTREVPSELPFAPARKWHLCNDPMHSNTRYLISRTPFDLLKSIVELIWPPHHQLSGIFLGEGAISEFPGPWREVHGKHHGLQENLFALNPLRKNSALTCWRRGIAELEMGSMQLECSAIAIPLTWYKPISSLRAEMGKHMAEKWNLASPGVWGEMPLREKWSKMAQKWAGHSSRSWGPSFPHSPVRPESIFGRFLPVSGVCTRSTGLQLCYVNLVETAPEQEEDLQDRSDTEGTPYGCGTQATSSSWNAWRRLDKSLVVPPMPTKVASPSLGVFPR